MARSQPAVERQRPSSGRTISQGGFPRNIWVLGWVSLLNDSATEMSYWLLPQFLVSVLRASPMAFGFIEGAAETAASLSFEILGHLRLLRDGGLRFSSISPFCRRKADSAVFA